MPSYKKITKNIQEVTIDNPKTPNDKLIWLNINNAGKREVEFLRKQYKFDIRYLHASLSKARAQRPIIRKENDYLFMILHFPIFKDSTILPAEIEFFIGHGYLITIHDNNLTSLNDFFNICKKDSGSILAYEFESSAILLYEILEKLMDNCFNLLDKNSIVINNVEDIIFAQEQKSAVSKILSLRHNIINFRKIIQNHKNIMKKLTGMESGLVPSQEIKDYYNRLLEKSKRIWENLENQREMIEVLNSTNESLLNYRLSDIMKTLTIFSVIVFPLTLLAAIFGMNTMKGMPLVNHPLGFWIIIIVMLIGCLGMLLFFERKRWL